MPTETFHFDVWDQATLTDVINRPPAGRAPGAAEDAATLLGETIAPFKSIPGRHAKVRVAEIKPFGTAPYRAPDASPATFKPAIAWSEETLELLILD